MKLAVILGDGMADWPVDELDGKTPLEAACHPHMDELARRGEFGLVRTVPEGMKPGSDTANLAVFGYDPRVYYSGRSPLEAMSLGIPLTEWDVTYRCNLVTLKEAPSLEESAMLDYSAGEISTEEAAELVAILNERLRSPGVTLHPGFSYRHCLVLNDAGTGAELTPPHDISGRETHGSLPAGKNAELLLKWMRASFEILRDHPINRARVASGKNPANAIWFWGEGRKPSLMPFFEKTGLRGAVISAVDLIQGIGRCAGMDVIKVAGATGTFETNFAGKAEAAVNALANGADFVYVHLEAPDECGHHGQLNEKIFSIEQIDEKVLGPVWTYLESTGEDYRILVLPDHPTPMKIRTHSPEPVPFALFRRGDADNRNARYTEREAAETGLFVEAGHTLVDRMRL